MTLSPVDVAHTWTTQGVPTFPVAIAWNAKLGATTKRPLTAHGHHDAATDPDKVAHMFTVCADRLRPGEELGVGVHLGPAGYLALDFDTKGGAQGGHTLTRLLGDHPDLALCRYRSASGALNVILAKPDGVEIGNATPAEWHGVDVRGDAGWIVAPGTTTTYGQWAWDDGSVPLAEAPKIPPAILARLTTAAPTEHAVTSSEVAEWISRHQTYTDATRSHVDRAIERLTAARPGDRHQALVTCLSTIVGLRHSDLVDARQRVIDTWTRLTAGEGRTGEPDEVLGWVIAQEQAKRRTQDNWTTGPPPGVDPDTGEILERPLVDSPACHIPNEFWEARETHRWIRQAAHARQRSADAVLHLVLARIAAFLPHTIELPGAVGAPAPLCHFALVVGPPGSGKSTASTIATELIAAPTGVADNLPIGSGEGVAEVLFETVEEDDGKGRRRKIKRQVRNNAYLWVDEGQVIGEIGGRAGGTLLPTLRTIWTGGTLGQANASAERRRIVRAGTYTYGIGVGLQPTKAVTLLEDAAAGLPQRFAWCHATDPAIPDQAPLWPGALRWEPPDKGRLVDIEDRTRGWVRHPLYVDDGIIAEIRQDDLARARGEAVTAELDSHATLARLKMAGLLALLGGHLDIADDDWHLAGLLQDASNATRSVVIEAIAADQIRRATATRQHKARDAVASDEAVERRRVVDIARKITVKVADDPDHWTKSKLHKWNRRWGDVLGDAIDHAAAEGWIDVLVETTHTGSETVRLRPGDRSPG